MPIRVFPPHYQLVYISFDISSFSLISYTAILHDLTNYLCFDEVLLANMWILEA